MVKHVFVVCLCLFLSISVCAANDSAPWTKAIHVSQRSTIWSVEQTFDGGFVAAGEKFGNDTSAALFIRLDSSGTLQWAKTYGPKSARANIAMQTSDGGFVFAGTVGSNHTDALIVKLDAAGNVLWQKAYGNSSSYDGAKAIVQTRDGGFFVLGNTANGSTVNDVWCMKLSNDGSVLWQKTYGNSNTDDSVSNGIGTSDGGLIFVGSTAGIDAEGYKVNELPWVVKLNQNGQIVWQKTYSSGNDSFAPASAITATADGGYVVAFVGKDSGAVKVDANGALSWQTAFHHDEAYTATIVSGVRQEKDGHILVMGKVGGLELFAWGLYQFVTGDIWTARLDSNGKMFWHEAFGKGTGRDDENILAIHDTPNDGTVFAGSRGLDGLVARTSSGGMVCSAFRKSLQITSYDISLNAKTAHLGIKTNTFVMRTVHLTQAPISVRVTDLCAGK